MTYKTYALPNVFHTYNEINDFINNKYTPYNGDESFLSRNTSRTESIMKQVRELMKEEQSKGILDVDCYIPSTITSFLNPPGYIDKENEIITGLQTDKPLKRAIKPNGGINMVKSALDEYGYTINPIIDTFYSKYRKTHNAGVFDAYTNEMKKARKSGILTGLPDGYGRGRIIGDYRRVPFYGVDKLIQMKRDDLINLSDTMTEEVIRLREEITEQIRALNELIELGDAYGFNLRQPAKDTKEAIQWLYLAYLAAVKEQDGAAMSLGRIDAFLDIYIENDLFDGKYTEEQIQEIIDDFVVKLRLVRQLRTPEYNALFTGDPTWVTASIGGVTNSGKHMITKTSYRILNTLYTLGHSPEPNMTVLWSQHLPNNFKRFCAQVSIDTSSIQYENDDIMRRLFGQDYGIACCVSAMKIGKDMQYFGARANLPKLLLYVLNQGRDELSGEQVGPKFNKIAEWNRTLNYEEVLEEFEKGMEWLAKLYCDTMNIIHFMHDKYNYERVQMALHDTDVRRLLAFGISGLSVVADSLSAIKYAKVTPIMNSNTKLIESFHIDGSFPTYGNDNDDVDTIAKWVVSTFSDKLAKQQTYRHSIPTLSILTITSNVVYGKKTGDTPDGRKKGEPFAPGANPLHGRDCQGAISSLTSVSKLPYEKCLDGISNTFNLVPQVLGKDHEGKKNNLVSILNGYFEKDGHHLNVNVLNKEMLHDAIENPLKYPNLTVRISGYAVSFNKLTREQQLEFINRTFHNSI
jgi:formate C-acetyltransferase